MIGQSTVIFQLGDNKNEVRFWSCWEIESGDKLIEGMIKHRKKDKHRRKDKRWAIQGIVDDAEVVKICNATNIINDGNPEYHRFAGDRKWVINLSGKPLHNPMDDVHAKWQAEKDRIKEARIKLNEFIPELNRLYGLIPEGTVTFKRSITVHVKMKYHRFNPFSTRESFRNGKRIDYGNWIFSDEEIAEMPEVQSIINDPARKAHKEKVAEVALIVGLTESEVADYSSREYKN